MADWWWDSLKLDLLCLMTERQRLHEEDSRTHSSYIKLILIKISSLKAIWANQLDPNPQWSDSSIGAVFFWTGDREQFISWSASLRITVMRWLKIKKVSGKLSFDEMRCDVRLLDSGLWTLDSAGALFFVFFEKFRFTVLKLLYRSRPFYSYASSRFHTKKFKFYAAAKHSASASRTDSSTVHQFSIFFKEWAVSCAALLHVMQSII